ncbi:hypothetical protein FWC31_02070 [Candidatus Saccharibacteria bacterium]|nr:hypothetical protein [Candidatus Saccharibacteria bacterium]
MAIGEVDLNNYARASDHFARQRNNNSTDCSFIEKHCSTAEKVFRNELPNGVEVVCEIKHRQKRSFSQDEISEMIMDYTENRLTTKEISSKFACSRQTISNVLRRNGVTVSKVLLSNDQADEAVRIYESGFTLVQVGVKLGVSRDTIQRALIRHGVQIRSQY